MKRIRFGSILICMSFLFLTSCKTTTPPIDDGGQPPKPEYVEILGDNKYERGFDVLGQWPHETGREVFKVLDYQKTTTKDPLWTMSRWTCKEGFDKPTTVEKKEGDTYIYQDVSKEVRVNPKTGSLYLELNTDKEYEKPRENGEGWMHLLIEQDFEEIIDITNTKKVQAEIDFIINKADNKMGSFYNPNIHTGHFLWYLTLQNRVPEGSNPEEVGVNGDYLWFGIPLYDYRHPNGSKESAVIDGGAAGTTGKLIYSMSTYEYLPPIEIGQEYKVSVDIMPYMKSAYNQAKEKGLLKNVKFENLRLTYMNLGWEVPGTFNVSSTVNKLSIKAYN